jgi:Protein tyrosine and serine/threonine kinase
MVLWEMWAKEVPFNGEGFDNRIEEAVLGGERPDVPEGCPDAWADMIQSCWDDEPSARPSLRAVLLKIRSLGTKENKDEEGRKKEGNLV